MTSLPVRVDVLKRGLVWLYETRQRAGSAVDPHGVTLKDDRGVGFRFVPEGPIDRPVVEVRAAHPDKQFDHVFLNGVADLIEALDYKIALYTHGLRGPAQGVFTLARPAQPSLLDAVRRYRAGCPFHGGDTDPAHTVNGKTCTWYGNTQAMATLPGK